MTKKKANGKRASIKTTGSPVFARLDPKAYKALQRRADANGRSMASELRLAVDHYLASA